MATDTYQEWLDNSKQHDSEFWALPASGDTYPQRATIGTSDVRGTSMMLHMQVNSADERRRLTESRRFVWMYKEPERMIREAAQPDANTDTYTVTIHMAGGVIQQIDAPAGIDVIVIDQDEEQQQ